MSEHIVTRSHKLHCTLAKEAIDYAARGYINFDDAVSIATSFLNFEITDKTSNFQIMRMFRKETMGTTNPAHKATPEQQAHFDSLMSNLKKD